MSRVKKTLFLLILTIFNFTLQAKEKPTLLFYCGITMVKPMQEIAKVIEKRHNCTIKIIQGASQDLYDSLKFSKKGDLYLPGSDSYRKKNLKDGLLGESVLIGYNQAAIFVQKGNPKKIKDLDSLANENIAVILCDPKAGSIGRMTKKILISYKGKEFFETAYENCVEIGTDSRNLNDALFKKRADVTINWKPTASRQKFLDTIKIDEKLAPKKRLVINLLTFSKYPDIAKALMHFSSSKEGQEIMRKYGFLD